MGDGAGGLSDVLRRMAEGEPARPSAARARSASAEAPPVSEARPVAPRSAPRRPPAAHGNDSLKAAAVPVCLTVAALLLVPATWAVLVLAGADVWRSDWPSARSMAAAMLTCLPLAAALAAGALYLRPPRRP